jgi:hypothetical protein
MSKQQPNRRSRKNTREKFRRRKISLISKADDLHRFFGADVFFAVRKKGEYYVYISTVNPYWPRTRGQIVRPFADLRRECLISCQERSYPPPEIKTRAEFDVIKREEKGKREDDLEDHVSRPESRHDHAPPLLRLALARLSFGSGLLTISLEIINL